jgi:hypothetical protein
MRCGGFLEKICPSRFLHQEKQQATNGYFFLAGDFFGAAFFALDFFAII